MAGKIKKDVKKFLIGAEMKSLSLFLEMRAETANDMPADQVRAFRSAMMKGVKKPSKPNIKGSKESVPFELIADEYNMMLDCVNNAKDKGVGATQEFTLTNGDTYKREFPCSREQIQTIENMINSDRKSEVIARHLTLSRLPISETTVKNSLNKDRQRRFEPTLEQRLAVSLFIDHCSWFVLEKKCSEVQYAILDFLYATKYDCRAIYYLIQASHELFEPVSTQKPDEQMTLAFLKNTGGMKFENTRCFRDLLSDK